jgi:uncharacterized RDD family membrane protein YckC
MEYAMSAVTMSPPSEVRVVDYAGFWRRVVAQIIDALAVNFCLLPVRLAMGLGVVPPRIHFHHLFNLDSPYLQTYMLYDWVIVIVWWLYSTLMESSRIQATLGKMALGIIVTDENGNRINFGRATGRHFAKVLSLLMLFIGYMMAGWTKKKQAAHDMIAGTLVIMK